MTQAENFTAAQASDPQTPGQVLADIAALRPDLRVAVAGNPSAYPGLLDWLKSLGEPAIDAAIAARGVGEQVTQQMPTLPPAAPEFQGMPPQGVAPPYGAPQGMPPQGMPPQGVAPQYGAPQGMPPQGMAPQYGAPQFGAAPTGSSNKTLWIVLGIVGAIILLGVGGFFIVRALTADDNSGEHGSDDALDALWDKCADEDWEACDDLYDRSETGTEYFDFGDTCGNRVDAGGNEYCVDAMSTPEPTTEPDPDPDGEIGGYGSDPTLDALWDSCEGGDWQACDDLYWNSSIDSEYETFADTCGNRAAEGSGGTCVDTEGAGGTTPSGDANAYGDDPTLDALWDACEGGDWQACDHLRQPPAGGHRNVLREHAELSGDRLSSDQEGPGTG
jgi:hypothetical protein